MPHANITDHPYLFGDPSDFGEFEEEFGDSDLYGDVDDDLYGDPDPLSMYEAISGDPGGGKVRNFLRKARVPLALAGGVGAGLVGRKLLQNRAGRSGSKARQRRAVAAKLARMKGRQTISNQKMIQSSAGRLNRRSLMSFFSLTGAKMNSSPIDPQSTFVMDMLKVMFDRQNSDTPFLQETAIANFAGGTWTATANGVVANRFYTALILQIGTNELNASPGTVVSITASLPTIEGVLTIAAEPFLLTYDKQYDVQFMLFPWRLVTNKPLPVLGQYSNANPITVAVTGIPAASSVNLIVPGSQHPWTVAMRNALI
jgi:hypothetical protein